MSFEYDKIWKKAAKKHKPRIKKKSKSSARRMYSKSTYRADAKRRKEQAKAQSREDAKTTDLQKFNERVKNAKALKKKREKALGRKEPIGFSDKRIDRNEKVKNAEKKKGVEYKAGTWYV